MYKKGEKYFQKAIELKPDYAETYYYMGAMCFLKNDKIKGIEYCLKAAELGLPVMIFGLAENVSGKTE